MSGYLRQVVQGSPLWSSEINLCQYPNEEEKPALREPASAVPAEGTAVFEGRKLHGQETGKVDHAGLLVSRLDFLYCSGKPLKYFKRVSDNEINAYINQARCSVENGWEEAASKQGRDSEGHGSSPAR